MFSVERRVLLLRSMDVCVVVGWPGFYVVYYFLIIILLKFTAKLTGFRDVKMFFSCYYVEEIT